MKGNFESLVALAQRVEENETKKQDYLFNTKDMEMVDDVDLRIPEGIFNINSNAHSQISDRLNIPKKYYDSMAEIPGLRTRNVNAWFEHKKEKRLVRTLDGNARAFLSDRFKPIDNFLILNGFLPVVQEMNMRVKSCSLTETKMYMQFIFPEIKAEVKKGDIVNLGVIMTNSEVGRGAVDVSAVAWRLVCENGMVGESLLNKYHTGRRIGDEIQDYNIFADDTIKAELDSFRKRLRDIFKAVIKDVFFAKMVDKMKVAAGDIVDDPVETLGNITRRYRFTQAEEKMVLNNYIAEGDSTRWGIANSITALAHDIEDRDRQHDVERIGYDIISLNQSQWKELSA